MYIVCVCCFSTGSTTVGRLLSAIFQSINQSVIISMAEIAEAITKSTVAQLEDDARK